MDAEDLLILAETAIEEEGNNNHHHEAQGPQRTPSGVVALREIKKYQESCELLIPKASFKRLVQEIAQEMNSDIRFTDEAIQAIREEAEMFLINYYEHANLAASHAGRVTIQRKDIELVARIRGSRR